VLASALEGGSDDENTPHLVSLSTNSPFLYRGMMATASTHKSVELVRIVIKISCVILGSHSLLCLM
jgi:hypothetical protein